jgi:mono/diheme cytochrome c family protein
LEHVIEKGLIMKTMKIMGVATAVAIFMAGLALLSSGTRAATQEFNAAGTYTAKCVACHGKAAEKKFNPSLPETEMVEAILKGKKGEKPPNMPAYGEKGITEDQAKALIAHMKSLKG